MLINDGAPIIVPMTYSDAVMMPSTSRQDGSPVASLCHRRLIKSLMMLHRPCTTATPAEKPVRLPCNRVHSAAPCRDVVDSVYQRSDYLAEQPWAFALHRA